MFVKSKHSKYLEGLTDGQKVAFEKITDWFFDFYETPFHERKDKQVFTLSGFAGSGKSYLMGIIDDFLKEYYGRDNAVQASAYTGKAATVLSEKGMNSSTLHHMLYLPLKKFKYNPETKSEKKEVFWMKKDSLGSEIKLIIVDEASMLPKKIYDDLLTMNLPILAVGDGFQLPSIDTGTDLLDDPDYTLTEITRQALDNSIIRMSMLVRSDGQIPFGDYGENAQVVNRRDLNVKDFVDIIDNYDQLLVGTNRTRLFYNTLYRKHLLGDHYDSNHLPCVDERVIITKNNWGFSIDPEGEYNLFNGLIGTVAEVEGTNIPELDKLKLRINFGKKEYVTDWIVYDTGIFRESLDNNKRTPYFSFDTELIIDGKGNYVKILEKEEFKRLPIEKQKEYIYSINNATETEVKVNHLDFAYAISVHKFQGSEADNVCLIDEGYVFDKEGTSDKNRWIYTGITRAKKFLLLVK